MKNLILSLCLCLISFPSFGDLIYLKNNVAIHCDVIDENDTDVRIKSRTKTKKINKSRIIGILYTNEYKQAPLIEYQERLKNLIPSSAKSHFELGEFCFENQLLRPAIEHFLIAQQYDSSYTNEVSRKLEIIEKFRVIVLFELAKLNYTMAKFETALDLLNALNKNTAALISEEMLAEIESLLTKTNEQLKENKHLYKNDQQALSLLKKNKIVFARNNNDCEKIALLFKPLLEKDPTKAELLHEYLKRARHLITKKNNTFADLKTAEQFTNIPNIVVVHKKIITDNQLKEKVIRLHDILFHLKGKFIQRKIRFPLLKKDIKLVKAVLYALPPEERKSFSLFAHEFGFKLKTKAQKYRFMDLNKYRLYLKSAIKCFKVRFATVEKDSKAQLAVLFIKECEKDLNSIGEGQLLSGR